MQFVDTQWLCDCAASSAVRSKWAPTSVSVDVCNLMIELSCLNRFCEKRSLPVCSSPPLTRRANPLKRTPALLSLHSYHQKFSSAKTLPCSHHLHPKNTLSRSVKIQNTETRLQTVATSYTWPQEDRPVVPAPATYFVVASNPMAHSIALCLIIIL